MTKVGEEDRKLKDARFSTPECFRAALKKLLKDEGYGGQVRLSQAIGRGTKHVNDVACGRRDASIEFQERTAAFYNMTHEDLLAMGRRLLTEGGEPFPHAEEAGQYEDREERGNFILQKTIEEVGLKDNPFFSNRTLDEVMRGDWAVYVANNMTDTRLYHRTKEEIKQIADLVSEHFSPKKKRRRAKKS